MKTGILLSYKGIGSNLLHLSYCHKIANKFGPVTIITLCKNLQPILSEDPLIKEVICLENYYKKFFDIFKLSKILKKMNLENLFIYYPSMRYFLASKISGIKNVYTYPLSKKNLHLVRAAKKFTEKNLKIENCPTETRIFVSQKRKEIVLKKIGKNKKNIIIGAGSSGPTTKWGEINFINLINKLNEKKDCFFYILCGPDENDIAEKIINNIGKNNCTSLSKKTIEEVIPIISVCDLYIGNDSFGQHVASQSSIPSIILLLDSPRAYSDYSKNQYRILPKGISLDDITHDSKIQPNKIDVNEVLEKALTFLN
tara:strand:- start:130 stop:1065 length:936 start_codon:yes stop_codon:yes gene_type:complete